MTVPPTMPAWMTGDRPTIPMPALPAWMTHRTVTFTVRKRHGLYDLVMAYGPCPGHPERNERQSYVLHVGTFHVRDTATHVGHLMVAQELAVMEGRAAS